MKNCRLIILESITWKRFTFLFAAIILSTSSIAASQTKLSKAKLITSFHFQLLEGGIILLQARLNDLPQLLNFVLDTGCSGISLDSSTAADLRLVGEGSDQDILGFGGVKSARLLFNQTLHLPNLSVDNLNFHLIDYGFLTESKAIKIDGLIGYSFLQRYIVNINYDSLKIDIYSNGFFNYPRKGFTMNLYLDNIPAFETDLKDRRTVIDRYILDTGADVCMLLSQKFVDDSAFLEMNKKCVTIPADGVGGRKNMLFTTIGKMSIGDYAFKNIPTYIFDDDCNVTRYPSLGGLIGSALLHRFNLIINYADATIHLVPNGYYKDPFDYTYTGFKIVREKNYFTISNVIKDSPAEKAGLQNGDLLLGVNENFSNNLESFQRTLSAAQAPIKISFVRDNQIRTTIVSIESVL